MSRERLELADDAVAAAVRARRRREPRRSAYSTTRSGNSSSSASTGVLSVFDIATWTRARAVGVRARALAAAERLVVGEVVVAEREVVHRPLAERAAERARARGRRRARTSRRCRPTTAAGGRALSSEPSGAITVDRPVGAGAGRDVGVGEHAHGEVGRRLRVTASGQLRLPACWAARAGEVERQLVAVDGRGQRAARGRRRAPRARRARVRVAVVAASARHARVRRSA